MQKEPSKQSRVEKGLLMATFGCSSIYITSLSQHLIQHVGGLMQNKVHVVSNGERRREEENKIGKLQKIK